MVKQKEDIATILWALIRNGRLLISCRKRWQHFPNFCLTRLIRSPLTAVQAESSLTSIQPIWTFTDFTKCFLLQNHKVRQLLQFHFPASYLSTDPKRSLFPSQISLRQHLYFTVNKSKAHIKLLWKEHSYCTLALHKLQYLFSRLIHPCKFLCSLIQLIKISMFLFFL